MHPNHSVSNIEEIIQGCKEGQRDSQRRLYEMYARSLLAVCMRYTKNRMEAEDFLHEGFLKIFDNIGQFESKGSIEGWLRRVMVNNILENYRKNSKYSFVDDSDINLAERYDYTEEDDGIEVSMSELHALIEQLPDRYKLVFKLYVLEQFSHEDIAKSLNISVGTSKSNLARARQWLQKRIDKKKAEKERALWQI